MSDRDDLADKRDLEMSVEELHRKLVQAGAMAERSRILDEMLKLRPGLANLENGAYRTGLLDGLTLVNSILGEAL